MYTVKKAKKENDINSVLVYHKCHMILANSHEVFEIFVFFPFLRVCYKVKIDQLDNDRS